MQVDAKTVERWITKGRIRYRRHRFEVATFLGVDESYIWPDALGRDEVAVVSGSEVVAVYPHRSEVPRDVRGHLFSAAEREIGVLVYAGLFLSDDAGIQKILKDKAAAGARVRILLGNPLLLTVARWAFKYGGSSPWMLSFTARHDWCHEVPQARSVAASTG